MAKVIEFYMPSRLRTRKLWNPSGQRGQVIAFSRKEITGVSAQLNVKKPGDLEAPSQASPGKNAPPDSVRLAVPLDTNLVHSS
jgi:hypothetical protein